VPKSLNKTFGELSNSNGWSYRVAVIVMLIAGVRGDGTVLTVFGNGVMTKSVIRIG
jgi:hypothetical protein